MTQNEKLDPIRLVDTVPQSWTYSYGGCSRSADYIAEEEEEGKRKSFTSLPSSVPFLLCISGRRRKRTAPVNISGPRGKSDGKQEVERQTMEWRASVKRWREQERQRERGRSKEQALEC